MRYELGTSFWARRLLDRELPVVAPDVLHVHTQGSALLLGDIMRRLPTVISADMTSRRTAEQFTRKGWRWTHGLHHAIEGAALRKAAALVAFSRYAASSMIDDYGVDPRKVFVIPPGVDLESFGDPGAGRAARDEGVRRILFVGGEFERKGGPELITAFLRAFGDRTDVELHLVTDASAPVPRHPRIVVHAGIGAYTPEWRALYEQAMLVALPSRREAYGLVYLEAGAARLPVIGSSVGAGPELVIDGETGFLVAPGDVAALAARLRTLVDDRTLARRLGESARARVERDFDAAKNIERLASVFESAAGKGA
jgi:glycosyltransferase involved in cell wall biosynthesis